MAARSTEVRPARDVACDLDPVGPLGEVLRQSRLGGDPPVTVGPAGAERCPLAGLRHQGNLDPGLRNRDAPLAVDDPNPEGRRQTRG